VPSGAGVAKEARRVSGTRPRHAGETTANASLRRSQPNRRSQTRSDDSFESISGPANSCSPLRVLLLFARKLESEPRSRHSKPSMWSRACHHCRLLRDGPVNGPGRLFANYGSRRVCDACLCIAAHQSPRRGIFRRPRLPESSVSMSCRRFWRNQPVGRRRLASPSNSLRVEDCSRPTRPTKISARA
jgi:hypothetical protein